MALILIGMIIFPIISALAQAENELILTLSRDFGYSSGGQIQGTFSMKVSGPENLQRVVFLIDGQQIGEDSEAPFSIQFHTGNYALGVHTLSAAGYTSDGRELHSNEVRREFVRADEGGKAALRIAGPIIGVTFGIILLSTLLPILLGRRKGSGLPLGAPRSYGMLGGTICPRCHRPFGIHIWGLNMLAGKLDRCPHCGRWSLVRRVSPEELKTAEAAELEMAEASDNALSHPPEDTLRKELDDSRFLDL
jgi:Bacterial Ig domain